MQVQLLLSGRLLRSKEISSHLSTLPPPDHGRDRDTYMYILHPKPTLRLTFHNSPVSFILRHPLPLDPLDPLDPYYQIYVLDTAIKTFPIPCCPLAFDITRPQKSETLRLLFRKEKINNCIQLLSTPPTHSHPEELRIATHTTTIYPCTKTE